MNITKAYWILAIIGLIVLTSSCSNKNKAITQTDTPNPTETVIIGQPQEKIVVEEKPVLKPVQKNVPYVLLALEKTDCMGICPTFELRVFSDGRVIYRGQKDVDKIGKYESRLSVEDIAEIVREAGNIRFFDMANKYPVNGHTFGEMQTTILSINANSKANTVIHNYDAPQRLTSFEDYVLNKMSYLVWRRLNA